MPRGSRRRCRLGLRWLGPRQRSCAGPRQLTLLVLALLAQQMLARSQLGRSLLRLLRYVQLGLNDGRELERDVQAEEERRPLGDPSLERQAQEQQDRRDADEPAR